MMPWETAVREQFERMIAKVPVFLRSLAARKVSEKAELLAGKENRASVSEKNLVDAFFAETPFGFHGPMKTDMAALGIPYTRYGYPE
jgi:hypothetical protein